MKISRLVFRAARPLFALGLLAPAGVSAGPAAEKSAGDLFHPTPLNLMREMSTDRPDKTESPYTVDAGHFQLEMDFANYTGDRDGSLRTRTWNVAPFNLKAGLFNNVDLQLVFDSFIHERVEDRAARTTERKSGAGDLGVRMKINLWGNDGGKTAFAVMPFVSLPTSAHGLGSDRVQGGVIFPLAVELPGGWGLGVMTEADLLRDADGSHAEFVNTITFSHDLGGKLRSEERRVGKECA